MIITCPSCEARFDIDPAQLGAEGRSVRCSQCGTDWYQDRREPSRPAAQPTGPAGRGRGKPVLLPRARWVLLFVLLVAWSGWIARDWVVDRFPAAAGIYTRLGIAVEVPGSGLLLEDVTSVRRLVDGKRLLIISGMVRNLTAEVRPVPALRASLSDDDGNELVSWEFSAEAGSLGAGARTRFRTTRENPPRSGATLALGFVVEN